MASRPLLRAYAARRGYYAQIYGNIRFSERRMNLVIARVSNPSPLQHLWCKHASTYACMHVDTYSRMYVCMQALTHTYMGTHRSGASGHAHYFCERSQSDILYKVWSSGCWICQQVIVHPPTTNVAMKAKSVYEYKICACCFALAHVPYCLAVMPCSLLSPPPLFEGELPAQDNFTSITHRPAGHSSRITICSSCTCTHVVCM